MDEYYEQQAGHGLAAYEGMRFQRGSGLFSFIRGPLWSAIKKAVPFVGKHALALGKDILAEFQGGTPIDQALKRSLSKGAGEMASAAMSQLVGQRGGRRRRVVRRRTTRKTTTRRTAVKRKRSVSIKGRRRVVKRRKTARRRATCSSSLY